ncbi:hypothetical protein [Raineyella sp. W15-4]|uniref:hypothetical protein n=1 Tax=Raineyella sp. W15-4 TaxID=3081651 RepID=UPI0029533CC5|nr:hypothetical protein [Raineyella sp. W15-4]WOQ16509.1 hypothetical protein R0145_15080 [Raineyella sp. W15-4]
MATPLYTRIPPPGWALGPGDERALQERAGEAYAGHRRHVPRWSGIPRKETIR